MFSALPEEQFPIPAVDLTKIDPAYYRRLVDYPSAERTETIIVDTPNRYLYLTMKYGKAMRYGVGIGRVGLGRTRPDCLQKNMADLDTAFRNDRPPAGAGRVP